MDIELIDKAWACLPKEFKEEVKRMYRIADSDVDQMIAMIMLENVFGHQNLTSKAEGKNEFLTVSRSKVTEVWQRAKAQEAAYSKAEQNLTTCEELPMPIGRKYALNFALADNSIIDGQRLRELFDPKKFMCKITPLHRTASCEQNHIATTGGYEQFTPYKAAEEDLKAHGFDVIVFVPSYDEDNGLITCGNTILSGKLPSSRYEIIDKTITA